MTVERDTTTVAFVNHRVVRYRVDQVGNHLDAVLRWCGTHAEPVWVYDDGSFKCPHDLITRVPTDDHSIVVAPWCPS